MIKIFLVKAVPQYLMLTSLRDNIIIKKNYNVITFNYTVITETLRKADMIWQTFTAPKKPITKLF